MGVVLLGRDGGAVRMVVNLTAANWIEIAKLLAATAGGVWALVLYRRTRQGAVILGIQPTVRLDIPRV
jgi:hypothetical protein